LPELFLVTEKGILFLFILIINIMMSTIQEVKAKHEAALLKIEGVISIGIGLKKDRTPAIIIGLKQENKDIIQSIPSVLDGYPVEIQIIGSIKAR
jgi:hypothetical protein